MIQLWFCIQKRVTFRFKTEFESLSGALEFDWLRNWTFLLQAKASKNFETTSRFCTWKMNFYTRSNFIFVEDKFLEGKNFTQKFKLSWKLWKLREWKKLLPLTFTRETTLWYRDREDTPCSKVITVVVDAVTVIWPIWRGRRCGVDWTEGKKGWSTVRRLHSLALRGFLMPLLLVLSVETVPRTTGESKSFR